MPVDLLPTLLAALPDLGVVGVVLVVLIVGYRILTAERTYFTEQRALLRQEAREDRADLRAEIKELKVENDALEARIDSERAWRRDGPPTSPIRPTG